MRRTTSILDDDGGNQEVTQSFVRPDSVADANPDDIRAESQEVMGQATIQEDNSGYFQKDSQVTQHQNVQEMLRRLPQDKLEALYQYTYSYDSYSAPGGDESADQEVQAADPNANLIELTLDYFDMILRVEVIMY